MSPDATSRRGRLFVEKTHEFMLDMGMLAEHVEVLDEPDPGALVFQVTCPDMSGDVSNLIMAYTEPPTNEHDLPFYEHPERLKAAFHFGPGYLMSARNCQPITEDPISYPYPPLVEMDFRREGIRMSPARRVIYFGCLYSAGDVGDCFERTSLYPIRVDIVQQLARLHAGNVFAYGPGWERNTRKSMYQKGGWRADKIARAEEHGADFFLCIENSQFHNYVTEKIHDAFATDRLVLYLGEPNIERWVPGDCFINLNPLFDFTSETFDHDGLHRIIMSVTEDQYRRTVLAAREWRKTLPDREHTQRRRMTRKVIEIVQAHSNAS